MGSICGPGGCSAGCCGAGVSYGPPIIPEGYGLGCCGLPPSCCGYGEGLGPGGPCSCGGDCCGMGSNLFGNAQYFDYFCCGCCGITQNRCCQCGTGSGALKCGGMGYCGGGCCCCCPNDYPHPPPPPPFIQPQPNSYMMAPASSPVIMSPPLIQPGPITSIPGPIRINPYPTTITQIRPSTPVSTVVPVVGSTLTPVAGGLLNQNYALAQGVISPVQYPSSGGYPRPF